MERNPIFALKEENVRRFAAEIGKLGLRWIVGDEVFAKRRAAMKATRDAAIAAAMSPDEAALFEAAHSNDAMAVRALLDKGVRHDVRTIMHHFEGLGARSGATPLFIAIGARAKDAVAALLEAGADAERKFMMTPLATAVHVDDLEIVRLILDHVSDRTAASAAVMGHAAGKCNRPIIELLIESGGLSVPFRHKDTVFQRLRAQGRADIVDLIESHLPAS